MVNFGLCIWENFLIIGSINRLLPDNSAWVWGFLTFNQEQSTQNAQDIYRWYEFDKQFAITVTSIRGQWVKGSFATSHHASLLACMQIICGALHIAWWTHRKVYLTCMAYIFHRKHPVHLRGITMGSGEHHCHGIWKVSNDVYTYSM